MSERYAQALADYGTVLVVDGDDDVRSLIRILLTRQGYRVLEAHDAEAAFEAAARHQGHIDLLITHVAVPGMRGLDLARQMRVSHNGLKVLFISELACDANVVQVLRRRTTELIRRPFSLQNLANRVGALMVDLPPPGTPAPTPPSHRSLAHRREP